MKKLLALVPGTALGILLNIATVGTALAPVAAQAADTTTAGITCIDNICYVWKWKCDTNGCVITVTYFWFAPSSFYDR